MSNDAILLIAILSILGAFALAALAILRGQDAYAALKTLLERLTNNQDIDAALLDQFKRLPPTQKAHLQKLVDILDPLKDAIPGDLDNQVVDFFNRIIAADKGEE